MGLKQELINRLKKHNGQYFEIHLETSEGISTCSTIDCADVYNKREINKLSKKGGLFRDDLINIVERDTTVSFTLGDKDLKSVEDNTFYAYDKKQGNLDDLENWIDSFEIEYENGTTISIDVFSNEEDEAEENIKEDEIEFSINEYIKELLSRRYFPEDDQTLVEVLTTLKSLEGRDLIIEHSGDIISSTFTIEEMNLEELIGVAIVTEGICLRDSYTDTDIYISEDRIKSFESLDAESLDEGSENGYEIKFDDGSYLTIEVLKHD
ncbi:hypothetical protein ABET51_12885 [Metabacillus fastidiosus]|uniref:hypothetical protein n=1 Tax=Metabacillus fastidiosus TaxID=1458 RepID=UPI003D2C6579